MVNISKRNVILSAVAAVVGLAGSAGVSLAQTYPKETIRFVVPFGAGGGADLTARILADELATRRGWSVVVDNKPGASTQIGSSIVARAKPDGYTVLWPASDGVEVTVATTKNMSYKVPEDFKFVTTLAAFPQTIGVRKDLPIHNVKELAEYAKAHPGELNYASSGTGGGGHLYLAEISHTLGLDMVHIPYDSGGAAAVAVAGGHADLTAIAPSSLKAYVDDGSIRPIVLSGEERNPVFPDVPTMKESGYPQFSLVYFYGMMVPAGTPDEITNTLRDAIAEIRNDPKIIKSLADKGLATFDYSDDKMRDYVVGRIDHWKKVVTDIGFKLN